MALAATQRSRPSRTPLSRRALDDAHLLELVGEVAAMLDISELRDCMLTALLRAVPAKWASLNEMSGQRVLYALVHPHLDGQWFVKFGELGHENPIYRNFVETGEGRPNRFSDVAKRDELEQTRLFQEVYGPLGIKHQIAFTLPSAAPDRVMAIALSREHPDFSDLERDFLDRARPFLIQAYRNAVAYSTARAGSAAALASALAAAGLTMRQTDVMRLVALGGSSRDIANELGLSERTVHKHLELAFRKLGVSTRSAAAARAWELANP